MGAQNNHLNVTVLLSTLNVYFSCKIRKPNVKQLRHLIWRPVVYRFLHRFVIDHINCYYFRLMADSIGRKYHCEAKG